MFSSATWIREHHVLCQKPIPQSCHFNQLYRLFSIYSTLEPANSSKCNSFTFLFHLLSLIILLVPPHQKCVKNSHLFLYKGRHLPTPSMRHILENAMMKSTQHYSYFRSFKNNKIYPMLNSIYQCICNGLRR